MFLARQEQLKGSLVSHIDRLFNQVVQLVLMVLVLNLQPHHLFAIDVGSLRPDVEFIDLDACVEPRFLVSTDGYVTFGLVDYLAGGRKFLLQREQSVGLMEGLLLLGQILLAELLSESAGIYLVTWSLWFHSMVLNTSWMMARLSCPYFWERWSII